MAAYTTQKRPFKICNSSRESKKGIACSSLQELKNISCERFMLNSDCRVFLESDGTEVDDEEYFQFLPPQTLFMVTESNDHWVKAADDIPNLGRKFNYESESQESYHGLDEADGPTALSVSLKNKILDEPMFFISVSTDELHKIADVGLETLQHELRISAERVQFIIDSCEQELSRRGEIKQAHELLSICNKAINRINRESDDGYQERKKLKS